MTQATHWTRLHIPTLRDEPSGIATAGERLLRRAGYLRDGGWLPLGMLSLRKIERAVRAELALQPGSEVADASDPERLLHGDVRSYKQLPRVIWSARTGVIHASEISLPASSLRIPSIAGVAGFIPAPAGPDLFLEAGGYAAPAELAISTPSSTAAPDPLGDNVPELVATPGMKTIADVAQFLELAETSLIKTLVVIADGAPVLVLLRGDHSLSNAKLASVLDAKTVRPADAAEIERLMRAPAGSLGPVGVRDIRILSDHALEARRNMVCGANKDDFHLRFVTPDRDFRSEYHDLRLARAGELAPNGQVLGERRGVMAATLASGPAKTLRVLNDQGKEAVPTVTRLTVWPDRILRAAAELGNDKDGLVLSAPVAPFDAIVTVVSVAEPALREAAGLIGASLAAVGLAVLIDDRDERPGVKFKDADLIGVPTRINVGKKIAEGNVEIVNRRTKEIADAPATEVARMVAG